MDKTVPIAKQCENAARERADYSALRYMAGIMQDKQFFDGIANAAKLITGPLVSLGGSSLIAASLTAAGTNLWLMPVALTLLGGAAVALTAAVAASYVSSNISRNHSVTAATLQAKLSAKALVQELKANSLCLAEQPERADGKSWSEVTKQTQHPGSPSLQ